MSSTTKKTIIRIILPESAAVVPSNRTIQMPPAVSALPLDFPDDAIRIILSSFSTPEAVRMSLVSKQWRRVWQSLNVFDFEEEEKQSKLIGDFCSFVDRCVKLRKEDMTQSGDTKIKRFRLAIKPYGTHFTDRLLGQVGQSDIEDFELRFYLSKEILPCKYRLPRNILPMRSLTRLRLTNVDITSLPSTSLFPLLKSTHLERVRVDDQVLESLLSGCLKLENLVLDRCFGLFKARISSLSLKSLRIHSTVSQEGRLEAQSLESFVFSGFRFRVMKLSLQSLGRIRSVSFSEMTLDNSMEAIISDLPCIESLTLLACQVNCSSTFKIHSLSLKRLVLGVRSGNGLRVEIDTLNLVQFRFKGSLVNLLMNAQNISESEAEISQSRYDMEWFIGIVRFLRELDCSKKLTIHIQYQQALIFSEEARSRLTPPIRNVEEFTVKLIKYPIMSISVLMDSLRWLTNN